MSKFLITIKVLGFEIHWKKSFKGWMGKILCSKICVIFGYWKGMKVLGLKTKKFWTLKSNNENFWGLKPSKLLGSKISENFEVWIPVKNFSFKIGENGLIV